jgi:hypothetical protein
MKTRRTKRNEVAAEDACPRCDERNADSLVWRNDETVHCANCGTNYDPNRLKKAAEALVAILGEPTAAAIAAKCQPVYTNQQPDIESFRLSEAIVEAIGPDRYRELDIL